jgi:3-oxoacyl-[acyl-carrier protein] reductase
MNNSSKSLSSKVALVTGGSAASAPPSSVVWSKTERQSRSLTQAQGKAATLVAEIGQAESLGYQADNADAEAVQAVRHGRLDASVVWISWSTTQGFCLWARIDTFSLEDFDRMIAINVRPVFVGAQAAGRHMREGRRIIVIGSVTADRTGFPGASVYSMTKAAVAVLARGLAIDFAPRGITVNTIQPGPTETDMNPADGPHSDAVKKSRAAETTGARRWDRRDGCVRCQSEASITGQLERGWRISGLIRPISLVRGRQKGRMIMIAEVLQS